MDIHSHAVALAPGTGPGLPWRTQELLVEKGHVEVSWLHAGVQDLRSHQVPFFLEFTL